MTKYIYNFIGLIGTVSLLSCSEIEVVKEAPLPQAGKIKSIIELKNGIAQNEISFGYDKSGVVSSQITKDLILAKTTTDLFKRDSSGKIISIEQTIGQTKQTINLTYKNGLLDQIVGTAANRVSSKHTYDANKNLLSLTQTSFLNNSPSFSGIANLEWQEGNIILLKNGLTRGEFEEETWQYSDKENPISVFYKKEIGLPQHYPFFASKNLPNSQSLIFADIKNRYSLKYSITQQLTSIETETLELKQWKKIKLMTIEYY